MKYEIGDIVYVKLFQNELLEKDKIIMSKIINKITINKNIFLDLKAEKTQEPLGAFDFSQIRKSKNDEFFDLKNESDYLLNDINIDIYNAGIYIYNTYCGSGSGMTFYDGQIKGLITAKRRMLNFIKK